MATPDTRHDDRYDDRLRGLIAVAVMVAIMWVLEIVDQLSGSDLDRYGIEPRDVDGLGGIVAAPFLHAGFDHLIGNTIPFLILGAVIALNGLVRVLATTAIIVLVAGLGTWLIAPAGTVHVGASGVVFGYAAYLMARGIFSRSMLQLAVGAIVLLVYSTSLLSALVPTPGISWQSHLFGALGGVLAAWLLDRRRDGSGATPSLELR